MQMKLFWWLLVENSFLLNFPHTTKFSVKTPGHPHDFWCNKNFIISKTSNNLYKLWRSQDIFIFFTCLSFCPNLWAPHFCLGSWVEGSYLKKKGETDVFLDRSPIFDQSNSSKICWSLFYDTFLNCMPNWTTFVKEVF